MSKLSEINDYLHSHNLNHGKQSKFCKENVDVVYDIMINNTICEDYNDPKLCVIAAIKYITLSDMQNAKKYFLKAIAKDKAMISDYAVFLDNQNLPEAEKYFQEAINNGNDKALVAYANSNLLKNNNRIDESKKYFLEAIEKKIPRALYLYACLLFNEDNEEEAKKYLLMAIENKSKEALDAYTNFLNDDKIQQYYHLSKLTSKIAKDLTKELLKEKEVFCFYRRLGELSRVDECKICLFENSLIPRECLHYFCGPCYVKMNKCPYCKF
jgi:tetratricopeptide (TPR) repeat protein